MRKDNCGNDPDRKTVKIAVIWVVPNEFHLALSAAQYASQLSRWFIKLFVKYIAGKLINAFPFLKLHID